MDESPDQIIKKLLHENDRLLARVSKNREEIREAIKNLGYSCTGDFFSTYFHNPNNPK